MTLTRSYRAGGEDLAELVNDAFYGGESCRCRGPARTSDAAASASTTSRAGPALRTRSPARSRAPTPRSQRVVTLVVEHAVNRGSESLMVVTASAKHAERVRAAVEAAFAGRSDVADFVSRDTAEPLRGAHARGIGRREPRPRDLLARLRAHQARPRAQRLRRPVDARRRAAADGRHDAGAPLDGDRLVDPPLVVRRRTPRARRRDTHEHPRRDRRARPRRAPRGSRRSAHPGPRARAAPPRASRSTCTTADCCRSSPSTTGKAVVAESDPETIGRVAARVAAAAPADPAPPRLALRARALVRPVQRPGSALRPGSRRCSASRRSRPRPTPRRSRSMSSNERQRIERVPGSRRARLTPAPGTTPEPTEADAEGAASDVARVFGPERRSPAAGRSAALLTRGVR